LEIQKQTLDRSAIYESLSQPETRYALANILAGEQIGITPTYRLDFAQAQALELQQKNAGKPFSLKEKMTQMGRNTLSKVNVLKYAAGGGNWAARYITDRFVNVGLSQKILNKGLEKKGLNVDQMAGDIGLASAKQMTKIYDDMLGNGIGIKNIAEGKFLKQQVEKYLREQFNTIGMGLLITGSKAELLTGLCQIAGVPSSEILMKDIRDIAKGKKSLAQCEIASRLRDTILTRLEGVKGQVKQMELSSQIKGELDQSMIAEQSQNLKNLQRKGAEGTGIIAGDARNIYTGSVGDLVSNSLKQGVRMGVGLMRGNPITGLLSVGASAGMVTDMNASYPALLNWAQSQGLSASEIAQLMSIATSEISSKYDKSVDIKSVKAPWAAALRVLTSSEKLATGAKVVGGAETLSQSLRQFAKLEQQGEVVTRSNEWLQSKLVEFEAQSGIFVKGKTLSNLGKVAQMYATNAVQGSVTGETARVAAFYGGVLSSSLTPAASAHEGHAHPKPPSEFTGVRPGQKFVNQDQSVVGFIKSVEKGNLNGKNQSYIIELKAAEQAGTPLTPMEQKILSVVRKVESGETTLKVGEKNIKLFGVRKSEGVLQNGQVNDEILRRITQYLILDGLNKKAQEINGAKTESLTPNNLKVEVVDGIIESGMFGRKTNIDVINRALFNTTQPEKLSKLDTTDLLSGLSKQPKNETLRPVNVKGVEYKPIIISPDKVKSLTSTLQTEDFVKASVLESNLSLTGENYIITNAKGEKIQYTAMIDNAQRIMVFKSPTGEIVTPKLEAFAKSNITLERSVSGKSVAITPEELFIKGVPAVDKSEAHPDRYLGKIDSTFRYEKPEVAVAKMKEVEAKIQAKYGEVLKTVRSIPGLSINDKATTLQLAIQQLNDSGRGNEVPDFIKLMTSYREATNLSQASRLMMNQEARVGKTDYLDAYNLPTSGNFDDSDKAFAGLDKTIMQLAKDTPVDKDGNLMESYLIDRTKVGAGSHTLSELATVRGMVSQERLEEIATLNLILQGKGPTRIIHAAGFEPRLEEIRSRVAKNGKIDINQITPLDLNLARTMKEQIDINYNRVTTEVNENKIENLRRSSQHTNFYSQVDGEIKSMRNQLEVQLKGVNSDQVESKIIQKSNFGIDWKKSLIGSLTSGGINLDFVFKKSYLSAFSEGGSAEQTLKNAENSLKVGLKLAGFDVANLAGRAITNTVAGQMMSRATSSLAQELPKGTSGLAAIGVMTWGSGDSKPVEISRATFDLLEECIKTGENPLLSTKISQAEQQTLIAAYMKLTTKHAGGFQAIDTLPGDVARRLASVSTLNFTDEKSFLGQYADFSGSNEQARVARLKELGLDSSAKTQHITMAEIKSKGLMDKFFKQIKVVNADGTSSSHYVVNNYQGKHSFGTDMVNEHGVDTIEFVIKNGVYEPISKASCGGNVLTPVHVEATLDQNGKIEIKEDLCEKATADVYIKNALTNDGEIAKIQEKARVINHGIRHTETGGELVDKVFKNSINEARLTQEAINTAHQMLAEGLSIDDIKVALAHSNAKSTPAIVALIESREAQHVGGAQEFLSELAGSKMQDRITNYALIEKKQYDVGLSMKEISFGKKVGAIASMDTDYFFKCIDDCTGETKNVAKLTDQERAKMKYQIDATVKVAIAKGVRVESQPKPEEKPKPVKESEPSEKPQEAPKPPAQAPQQPETPKPAPEVPANEGTINPQAPHASTPGEQISPTGATASDPTIPSAPPASPPSDTAIETQVRPVLPANEGTINPQAPHASTPGEQISPTGATASDPTIPSAPAATNPSQVDIEGNNFSGVSNNNGNEVPAFNVQNTAPSGVQAEIPASISQTPLPTYTPQPAFIPEPDFNNSAGNVAPIADGGVVEGAVDIANPINPK
jgi:hypothetical protein